MTQKNNLNGILLLDKPLMLSSNQVIQKIKKQFNIGNKIKVAIKNIVNIVKFQKLLKVEREYLNCLNLKLSVCPIIIAAAGVAGA